MKTIILALSLAASLMACGGKSKKGNTPNTTGTTTETKSDGTGGSTYGGTQTPAPPTETPPAGQ